jgi:hypothetical protein
MKETLVGSAQVWLCRTNSPWMRRHSGSRLAAGNAGGAAGRIGFREGFGLTALLDNSEWDSTIWDNQGQAVFPAPKNIKIV